MNAIDEPLSDSSRGRPARVVSIDIFRGLVMMVMIFVNELAGVRGLPWWNYHMAANIDAMTYVDMVFPLFLFIVGLSLPLAVKQRLTKTPSIPALWRHIAMRTAGLIVLGLILANAEKGDAALMHLSQGTWALAALVGAILFWAVYGRSSRYTGLFRTLRFGGLALMIVMLAIFRRTTPDSQIHWIDFSYPEILGLIGFSYLAVCVLYIPTRRWLWAPVFWFAALLALCAHSTLHRTGFASHWPIYVWPFGNGAMACIVMAGVVTSNVFLEKHRWCSPRRKMLAGAGFALLTLALGVLLTPLGISKIRATPTWSLYSIGAGVLLFSLLYWICDRKGWTRWAFFVRSSGANTLMTYLLPDFYVYILSFLGVSYFETHWNVGWAGALRAAAFTACILALSTLLTRWKIRLHL